MKNSYTVLHIISSLAQGGAETQLLELVSKNSSHEICQLLPLKSNKNDIDKVIYSLNMNKKIPDIRVFYRLNRVINKVKPDIIHTWMYHSSLIEVLLRKFLKPYKVPLVWGLRCSNMDVKYYSKQLNIIIKACSLFSDTPDLIINNSYEGKNVHDKLGFNKRSIVIPNGIDTKKFSPNKELRLNFRSKYNISNSTKVLLCVSRYDPMKDHKTLLNSYRKILRNFSNIILILAGIGTEKFKDLSNVIALGSYDKVHEVYCASDLIVSSSAFGEGFSNALGEGMASGLIPVSTNVGDARFIISNIGKIVSPKDSNGLANAILEILNLSEKKISNIKEKARKQIIENFSKDNMINNYNNTYKNLLK